MNKNSLSATPVGNSLLRALFLSLLLVCTGFGAYNSGQFLTGSNQDNNYSSVAVGPGNVFYGAWKATVGPPTYAGFIKFATYNGITWTEIPASFNPTMVSAQLPGLDYIADWGPESIAVDTSGNIHVVFATGASAGGANSIRGLAYGKYTASSSTWAFRRLFILQQASGGRNVGNGQYALKLDSSQNPHVVFEWGDATGSPALARLQYAYFNGTVWNVSGNTNALDAITVDTSAAGNQEGVGYPDIVFDSTGRLHVAYLKERADQISPDIWYSSKPSGSTTFSTPAIAANVGNASAPSIVVNAANVVSIADAAGGGPTASFRVTTNSSGSFATSTVASYTPPGAVTTYASYPIMKIGPTGLRVMVSTVQSYSATFGPQVRSIYETSPGTWVQEAVLTESTEKELGGPSMALRNDNTIMTLFGRAEADYDPDVRNLYYATGIPTGFGPPANPNLTINDVSLNEGNAGTTSFTFTVSLSAPAPAGGVTFDIATANGTATAPGDYTAKSLTSQTIPAGSSTYSFTVLVNGDTTVETNKTFFVNVTNATNATITDGQGLGTIVNDDVATADLAITVTDGVTTAVPGGSVTYTITASNAGPSAVTGATLADTFPAALTATWTAVGAGGGTVPAASGSGNINASVNLPAGGSVTYTVIATISPSATGTLSNTATISSGITDPTPGNNSATDTDTLTPQANLGITVTDGVTTAAPGGTVTYTITASNAGPSNATGATLADTFPAALTATWTAAGTGGGTVPAASGSGNINAIVNLPAGGSVTYTVTATISPSASGTLANTATITAPGGVTDPVPANNSATDTDTLAASANLAITVTDGVATAIPGGSVTYTITVSNAGPSNAPGAIVADTFPAALTATWTAVGAGGGTVTAAGSGNINDTVNLPAGGSVTYTVSATISPSATGTLSNTATVTAPAGVTDPVPGNNSATDTDTLTPQASLGITVTDGVTTATPGGSVTYTIIVSNAGPSNAPGATVADTFPASLTATWTAVGAGGGTATAAGSGNINDTVNLPAGGSVTYTVNAAISASATGTLSNTATVTAPAGVTDPVPGNNSATDTDTLSASADLAVTVTDGVTTTVAGTTTTYTITASNAGPSNATGATLADIFPVSLTATWTAVGAGGGTVPVASGSGNINASVNLPPGGSVTYTVTATVSAAATGTLSNTATITAPGGLTDPVPGNNSATDTNSLTSQADLAVTVTDAPDPVQAGQNVTYTLTVTNNGPSFSENVAFGLQLPPDVTFVSATRTVTGGFADGWITGVITPAVGDTGTITITASQIQTYERYDIVGKVGYVGNGTVLSAVGSATAPTDPNSANNTATATTTVSANPEIALHDGANTAAPQVTDGQVTPIDFGSTTVNNPVTRSFTVVNTGNATLTVSSLSVSAGFSLLGPFTLQQLAPEASFTFQVIFDASTIGTTNGSILITNNDADENPFNFPVTAVRTNVAPVAVAQDLTIDEDAVTPILLTGTDGDTQQLTFTIIDQPQHGTLSGTAPNLTYTPAANYNGADVFTFKANDGTADSATVEVNLDITPVNDAPEIIGTGMPDIVQIRPDVPRTIDLTAYFSDVETASTNLTYTVEIISANTEPPAIPITPEVQAVVNGTTLTISSSVSGVIEFKVTAKDPEQLSVSDTFTLTVKHAPQTAGGGVPPTLVSPTAPTFDLDLAAYFIDRDGDALSYQVTSNSNPGVLTATVSGSTLTITPVTPGVATLTVRVTDSDGNAIDYTFDVTIDDPIPEITPTPSSPPVLNRQTGMWEISVTAVNNNQFNVPGFRFRVTSALPAGMKLHNSTAPAGSAEAYLDVLTTLTPGQSLVVVLEFFSPTRNYAGFNPTIIAEPLPEGLTNVGTGAGLDVTRFVNLPDGSKLLEFSSVAGHWYQIEYSSDLVTWKRSLVPVQAGANFTQWIDRGPPYTDSHPSTVTQRYYRVSEILPQ